MVKMHQHSSSEYAPRTFYNVQMSDMTIAFYVDNTTAGEVLTKKACVKKPYLGIHLLQKYKQNVDLIVEKCFEVNPSTINIAGNGLNTINLRMGHVEQDVINIDIYNILSKVHEVYTIKKIISGGQTGVDWAAGVAASVLDIECIMTFPKGFRQRGSHGIDFTQNYMALKNRLNTHVRHLKKHINNKW